MTRGRNGFRRPATGASLSALSPAISECDALLASPVPIETAAVLVAAIRWGIAAGRGRAAVLAAAEPGSIDAVDSTRAFSARRGDPPITVAVFTAWRAP